MTNLNLPQPQPTLAHIPENVVLRQIKTMYDILLEHGIDLQISFHILNGKKLTFISCMVTPELAADMLELNTENRKVRPQAVIRYAKDMLDGDWVLNGDTIVFGPDGLILMNGQHRLKAIVRSRVTIPVIFLVGIDLEAYGKQDSGESRSINDVLVRFDPVIFEKNGAKAGAAARLIYHYKKNNLPIQPKISNYQVLSVVKEENPLLIEYVNIIQAADVKPIRSWSAPVAAVARLGAYTYPEQAKQFVQSFVTGTKEDDKTALDEGNPIYPLRLKAQNPERKSKKAGGNAGYSISRVEHTIFAWNRYVTGRTMKQLRRGSSGIFPIIAGAPDRE